MMTASESSCSASPCPTPRPSSSTCATIRKLLDKATLTELVKASLPSTLATLATSIFSGASCVDPKDAYRDFALLVTTVPARAVPNLSDFAFSVRCTQAGVTLPWFSSEAEEMRYGVYEEIYLSFPANVVEQLTFQIEDMEEDAEQLYDNIKYEILGTDLRTGRSRLVAIFRETNLNLPFFGDTDSDTDEDVYDLEAHDLSLTGSGFFDQGRR